MLFSTTGLVKDNLYVTGINAYPIYLIDAPHPVLFDAGTTSVSNLYVESIRTTLGTRQPSILFLSHVHWDHCGSVSYLKDAFPALKIAASAEASEILKRPNAQALITKLNEEARNIVSTYSGVDSSLLIDDSFRPFEVDIKLQDGHTVDLGSGTIVEVLATPGHTRDHLSYYLPQEKILIAPEAAGCLENSGGISTEFLCDYELYMASMQRLSELSVEVFCQGHRVVFVGQEEVQNYFARSIKDALYLKQRIYQLLDEENGDIDRVIQKIKAERYDAIPGIKQPLAPYLLNVTAQVKHLAKKRVNHNEL